MNSARGFASTSRLAPTSPSSCSRRALAAAGVLRKSLNSSMARTEFHHNAIVTGCGSKVTALQESKVAGLHDPNISEFRDKKGSRALHGFKIATSRGKVGFRTRRMKVSKVRGFQDFRGFKFQGSRISGFYTPGCSKS